jgi:hypothetical protein
MIKPGILKYRHSGAITGFIGDGTRNPVLDRESRSWIPGSARKQRGQPRNDKVILLNFSAKQVRRRSF